jgi:hypothetical protein
MNAKPIPPVWFLLTRHWLSLVGAALITTAVISWLFVLPQQIRVISTIIMSGSWSF